MEKLGLNEIREKYLAFFEGKAHLRLPSFPLMPQGDSSLLLINSGMAPMKPWFSGEATPPQPRVTTCQKCIRTPDIERVGKTSRHGTFFEMLGNFSFGDYFKHEACAWAWEFVTGVMQIPKDLLHVTVYLDDDEAWDIWEKEIGIEPSHISRLGKADNFWEIGAGPCGPCSEIYFDRGAENGCGSPDCKVGCDCDRYVEFWNLVFTQFNNDGENNYTPLAKKNIDTGMGLERLACIMQGVPSLFDVDTVMNITRHVSEITGATYGRGEETDVSLRVITDHIRSTTMMICDGVLPSNEGRGYVLRRLLRRAARHGRLLGHTQPFLHEVCQTVIRESRAAYPELEDKRDYITRVIRVEEENFNRTIDKGLEILMDRIAATQAAGKTEFSGADAFQLYDTYGFPVDLTLEILDERKLLLERAEFDRLMQEQRQRARAATAALGDFGWAGLDLGLDKSIPTQFTGYDEIRTEGCRVLAIVSGDELRASAFAGEQAVVVLDKTPFYAESGGQASDHGYLTAPGFDFMVTDVRKSKDGKFMHSGLLRAGELKADMQVIAAVDAERRQATARAHSATHLLHAALRQILGEHVGQAGSLVEPDRLRFDFTHFSSITDEELLMVEKQVNRAILAGLPVAVEQMSQEEAKRRGAMALFGEKYGDTVRVVTMGGYSMELCGGTHLDNTAKVGPFRITSEGSVAAGVRRIEGIVGKVLLETMHQASVLIRRASGVLKTQPEELLPRIEQFITEHRDLRHALESLRDKQLGGEVERVLFSAKVLCGLRVLTVVKNDLNAEDLRKLGDHLRDRDETVVAVLAAAAEDKITFLAVCGKEAIARGVKAGDLIRHVTQIAGGSGGGKAESAMGGGKDLSKLDDALAAVDAFVSGKLG